MENYYYQRGFRDRGCSGHYPSWFADHRPRTSCGRCSSICRLHLRGYHYAGSFQRRRAGVLVGPVQYAFNRTNPGGTPSFHHYDAQGRQGFPKGQEQPGAVWRCGNGGHEGKEKAASAPTVYGHQHHYPG